jgi:single-strand DNA-binding protein
MLKVQVIGNIGSEPEMKFTANGTATLRFSVASNGRVKNQAGEWGDRTDWIRCTVFGQRAEKLNELLHKGQRVFVDGRLEARPWLDRRNEPQAGLELVANDVEFVSSRQGEDNG